MLESKMDYKTCEMTISRDIMDVIYGVINNFYTRYAEKPECIVMGTDAYHQYSLFYNKHILHERGTIQWPDEVEGIKIIAIPGGMFVNPVMNPHNTLMYMSEDKTEKFKIRRYEWISDNIMNFKIPETSSKFSPKKKYIPDKEKKVHSYQPTGNTLGKLYEYEYKNTE